MFGALIDLEREDCGPGLGRDQDDAVGSDEAPEDVRGHEVGEP